MNSSAQAPAAGMQSADHPSLQQLFIRLKRIRNVSLSTGILCSALVFKLARKPLGASTITAVGALVTLALASALTAQLLLSLNEQLEQILNHPPPHQP